MVRGVCAKKKVVIGLTGTPIVNKPSDLIGIVSLTPRVDYCHGNDFDTTLETLNDIHKPALDAIGFQDRMCETLDWKSVKYNADGNKINGSIGKQPAWIDYMTNFNKTFGIYCSLYLFCKWGVGCGCGVFVYILYRDGKEY